MPEINLSRIDLALIEIDQNWSALRGTERHSGALIEGVLIYLSLDHIVTAVPLTDLAWPV